MASLRELQVWADGFLREQATKTGSQPRKRFSHFDPEQMRRALDLADEFAGLADSRRGTYGLDQVRRRAEEAAALENTTGLVRHALMVFMTHHLQGRRLKIRPLYERAPEQVLTSRAQQDPHTLKSLPELGPEARVDWWRED